MYALLRRLMPPFSLSHYDIPLSPDYQPQRRLHLAVRGYVRALIPDGSLVIILISLFSYFVTELLGTDLHRLLTSRPLEKQFIQYFLYQILVRPMLHVTSFLLLT